MIEKPANTDGLEAVARNERKSLEVSGLKELVISEQERIGAFFGRPIDIPPLPDEVTSERYDRWHQMGLELHYLPGENMTEDRDLPGWKQKPARKLTPDQTWGVELFDEVQ